MPSNKSFTILLLAFPLTFGCNNNNNNNNNSTYHPSSDPSINGYVPDKATAERIAEAVWLPVYGDQILQQKPFQTALSGDSVWIVEGTLPVGYLGGSAYIEIKKADGRILKITHGK